MSSVIEFPKQPQAPLRGLRRQVAERGRPAAAYLAAQAHEIRQAVERRRRLSGAKCLEEICRIAENLFRQHQRVKAAGRGTLKQIIEMVSPGSGPQYLFEFILDPEATPKARAKKIARLRKQLQPYVRISEALAGVLGEDPDVYILELFRGTSFVPDEWSPDRLGDEESLVLISQALRLIAKRLSHAHRLREYFAAVDRYGLVPLDYTGRVFRDAPAEDDDEYDAAALFACPRVPLFYESLATPCEVEVDSGDGPQPGLAYPCKRISVALVPACDTLDAEAALMIEPVTVVESGTNQYERFNVVPDSGWYCARDEAGSAIRLRYPEPPNFAELGFEPGWADADFLVELVAIKPEILRRIISTRTGLLGDEDLGGALTKVTLGPTLARRETTAAALEQCILYGPEEARLPALLEADVRHRLVALERWQRENGSVARRNWDACLAALISGEEVAD